MTGKTPRTVDELRSAIDREGQGDKVDYPDPAAAPLGTDAEAGGHPPTPDELALEPVENKQRPRKGWTGPALYVLLAALVFGSIAAIVLSAANG